MIDWKGRTRVTSAHRVGFGAVLVSLIVAVLWFDGGVANSANSVASTAQVLRLVATAPAITKVPPDLMPALQDAPGDSSDRMLATQGCLSPPETVEMPACLYGDPRGKHTLVLYGDSHASMWLPGFDAMAKRIRWKVVLLAKSGCGTPDISVWDPFRRVSPFKECDRWHSYAIARINRTKPDLVVLTSEYLTPDSDHPVWPSTSAWATGLVKTLNLLKSTRTKSVVLGDIPYLTQPAPDCLAAHQSDVPACSTPAGSAVKSDRVRAEQLAAAKTKTKYIKVAPWFCSTTCTAVVGNKVVYFDAYHASSTYVVYLSGALQAALRPLLPSR